MLRSNFSLHFVFYALGLILVFVDQGVAQVRVKGYTRNDGTYVRPHYRSRPDGDFSNNWSTKGNTNPYTGKAGTKTRARRNVNPFDREGEWFNNRQRATPGTASASRSRVGQSTGQSQSISTSRPAGQTYEESIRIHKARQLEKLGEPTDWKKHSYVELNEMLKRVEKANELQNLGHTLDWKKYSLVQMNAMSERLRLANYLARLGYPVNWQDYQFNQLNDMALRINRANALKARGRTVDWKKHTYAELTAMMAQPN